MKEYHKVLSIAGSDNGGCAGMQADLKAISATGSYGMSAFTGITSQNIKTGRTQRLIDTNFVAEQINTLLEDMGVDSVKIGMTFSKDIIETIADCLKDVKSPIVLDTIVGGGGCGLVLLDEDALNSFKTKLIPLATVITPNIYEAAALLGKDVEVSTRKEMEEAAKKLGHLYKINVLVKGGHKNELAGDDVLFDLKKDTIKWFKTDFVDTPNTHGAGCSLSSSIASFLAQGFSLEESVQKAKDYMYGAIKAGSEYKLGADAGPIHFFYKFWK